MMKSLPSENLASLLRFLAISACICAASTATGAQPDADPAYPKQILPLLTSYCLPCHGPEKEKGSLRIDRLNPDSVGGPDASHWQEISDELHAGRMPPKDQRQPGPDERRVLSAWLVETVAKARKAVAKPILLRRLNRREYGNTLRDLLGIDLPFEQDLPPDGLSEEGFRNDSSCLTVSPVLLEYYGKIAAAALDKAIVTSPRPPTYRVRWTAKGTEKKGELIAEHLPLQEGVDQPKFRLFGAEIPEPPKGVAIPTDHFLLPTGKLATTYSEGGGASYIQRFDRTTSVQVRCPSDGPVRIRVSARATRTIGGGATAAETVSGTNQDSPWLAVQIGGGNRYGATFRLLGPPMQVSNLDQQIYEITGRLENMPINIRDSLSETSLSVQLANAFIGPNDKTPGPDLRIDQIEYEAPYFATWPPESHRAIFIDSPNRENHDIYAREVLERFMSRAWRRPPNPVEVDRYFSHWKRLWAESLTSASEVAKHPASAAGMKMTVYDQIPPHATLQALHALKPVGETVVPNIQTYWWNHPVLAPYQNKDIAVCYSGGMTVPRKGKYRFTIDSCGGSRLYLDGQEIIDNDAAAMQHDNSKSGTVQLSAGSHAFALCYRKGPTPRVLLRQISWEGPGIDPTAMSNTSFTVDPGPPVLPLSFEETIRETLTAVLTAPPFLYLWEENMVKSRAISDHQLASRLSYFLWNGPPDAELLRLAEAGKLHDQAVMMAQVDRLIADERAWRFITSFVNEWLELDAIDSRMIDPAIYGKTQYLDVLVRMREETNQFFHEILICDLSALNLLDSQFAMLDPLMARHYAISGVTGYGFRRVTLTANDHRGGLLSQASVLTGNSTGRDSHPVKRGSWLLRRLLNDPPPPPPPVVPELGADDPKVLKLPWKEQLEHHRSNPACASCHQAIDPWGLPFENYDALGIWRTVSQVNKLPVEARSDLPDGTAIDGLAQLRSYLVEKQSHRFSRALTRKLLAYALGRSISLADTEVIDGLTATFSADDHRLRSLIKAIVTCRPFHEK